MYCLSKLLDFKKVGTKLKGHLIEDGTGKNLNILNLINSLKMRKVSSIRMNIMGYRRIKLKPNSSLDYVLNKSPFKAEIYLAADL
jgi:hypothetical protein